MLCCNKNKLENPKEKLVKHILHRKDFRRKKKNRTNTLTTGVIDDVCKNEKYKSLYIAFILLILS